jgi:hypothetical protein
MTTKQDDALEVEKLSIGDIVQSVRRLSIGSVVWLIGLLVTAFAGVWGASHWWTLRETSVPKTGLSIVPPAIAQPVGELPQPSIEGTDLLKDISVFDLRSWTPTGAAAMVRRESPVNYINYLHLKKVRPIEKYVIRYGTEGYAIDLRCITHAFTVLERERSPQQTSGKQYALEVDISSEPVGREFLLVVEATYWNGFSNPNEEYASTYTDTDINPSGELALIVLFPESKPFTEYKLLDGPSEGDAMDAYRGVHSFYADSNKRFIYWSIRERKVNHRYKLHWKW